MTTKDLGKEHGATVRKGLSFAASLVAALGKDIALNVQRGGNYLGGFASGLVRGDNARPNA